MPGAPQVAATLTPFQNATAKLQAYVFNELIEWARVPVDLFLDEPRVVHDWEEAAFMAWVVYGFRDSNGERGVDILLRKKARSLSVDELRTLRAIQNGWASLFEVHEVRLDECVVLFDTVSGETVEVRERLGTHGMRVGDLQLAWLMPMGTHVEYASATKVPFAHAVAVASCVHSEMSALATPTGPNSARLAFARVLPAVHRRLRKEVREWKAPTVTTDDGEELGFYQAVYEARDPERVRAVLQQAPGVEHGEGERFSLAAQVRMQGKAHDTPVAIELRTVRLSLGASTASLLAAARRQIEGLLGKLVRHRFDSTTSMQQMAENMEARGDGEPPAAGQDVMSPVVAPRGVHGGRHDLPPLPHEVMGRLVPGLKQAAVDLGRRSRAVPGWERRAIPREEFERQPEFDKVLRAHVLHLVNTGHTKEYALEDANYLGSHLYYMANHELHLHKTFFVDEALAWMLANTDLDVPGELLRLPFPCSAFVFSDPVTLELAESLLRDEVSLSSSGKRPAIVTFYVIQGPVVAPGSRGLYIYALFDALNGKWPYLVGRDLVVHDEARLDAVLDSRSEDVDPGERDLIFSTPELKKLLHLVLNALMYATSVQADALQVARGATITGPKKKKRQAQARAKGVLLARSGDDVYHLPGTIDISHLRSLTNLGGTAEGQSILKRSMVRGHWRRAASDWKDQRARWIEPYWKGPELAAVIERKYKLKL